MSNTSDADGIRTPLWKISNGKNGDKYLTFSGPTASSSNRNSENDENQESSSSPAIRVYKLRWYILSVICIANIANAINWIIYSAIADFAGEFYSVDYDSINFLSLVYLIISIPAGFFSFWIIDNFGIRTSINLGAWFNFLGALIKVLSSVDSANGKPLIDKSTKYPILMLGQCFCALAQPFIMFVTTKFANTWFADDQRALANTLALGSNTLGILIGAFVSPLIVDSEIKLMSEMCLLHLICCGASLLPAVMSCFIRRSNPILPPSYSAIINQTNEPKTDTSNDDNQYSIQDDTPTTNSFSQNFKIYLNQIKSLFKSKDFLILFFSFGVSLGLFNALTTLIEQMLCVRGYTDNDAGYFGGAMILSGIVGSIIAGVVLDKTKRFEEMAKICFCASALTSIFFVIIQLYNNDKSTVYYLLLISFCLIGFFGLPLLPICMEMSVECVYPIPEATTTGLLFIGGQIVGVLMIILYPKVATKIDPDSYVYNSIQTCKTFNSTSNINTTTTTASSVLALTVVDFKYPLYTQCLIQTLISIFFTIFFKCSYLRLRSEREKLAEKILNTARM